MHKLQARLHTRTIIRDGSDAFVGSQSLRAAELDQRRELGLILDESKTVKKLLETFEADWGATATKNGAAKEDGDQPATVADKVMEKAMRVFTKELDPLTAGVKTAVRKAVAKAGQDVLHDDDVKDTMKKVVKKAVKDAVKEAVEEAEQAQDAKA